jgi:peptidylprolyl isomerase
MAVELTSSGSRSSRVWFAVAGWLVAFFTTISAGAQESASAISPQRAAYQEAERALRDHLKQMWSDMILFHTADPDDLQRQVEMRGKWRDSSFASRTLRRKVVEAAAEAFRASPQDNMDLIPVLLQSIEQDYEADAYDGLGERVELLIDQPGVNVVKLHEIAGISFYVMAQYDRAKPHLTKVAEADKLDQRGRAALGTLTEQAERWEEEQAIRAAEAMADNLPRVQLKTTRGDVVLELFEDQAPQTVGNFISLVEQGFYTDIPFYMVISGVMAITGDPTGEGSGNAGYRIRDENLREDARHSFRGSIGMAKLVESMGDSEQAPQRVVPESAGSQFFLTYQPLPGIDDHHTIFGRVIEGWEAIESLTRINPRKKDGDRNVTPDRLLEATVIRKRDHAYVPEIAGGSVRAK